MTKWQKHPSAVWSDTIVDQNGDTVCSVACSYRTKAEVAKTVALVIAAPDLLEALDRAHLEIIKLLNEGHFGRKVVLDLGYIVDVVAKARGET